MRRLETALSVVLLVAGCEQLGNPRQYATPPTQWRDANGELTTSTRSFRNQKTIRRLVSDGIEDFDYSAPSIGPRQTLTIVDVAAQSFRASRGGKVSLVTRFELPNGQSVKRGWKVAPEPPRWTAAFALPAPPDKAITAVVP